MIYNNRKISVVLESNINIVNGLNSEIENLNKKAKIQIENNFFSLDKGIKLINLRGDTLKLEDVISDKTLVFRYSMLNCGACIQKEFENIIYTNFDRELQKKNIIFIAFYQEHHSTIDMVVAVSAILGVAFSIFIILGSAHYLVKILGSSGIVAISKIVGFIVIAIGIQYIVGAIVNIIQSNILR